MFDFVKTNIKNILPEELIHNRLLNFAITVDSEGEIKNRIAEYNNLKFKIVNERFINLNGSVHKYYNEGVHNYNDFTIRNFVDVCKDLSQKFDINPFLTTLHNLEFGINVILPFDTNSVLDSIISYKGKEYEMERYNGRGYLLRFTFDHYELKIYNKGLQYQQTENILRFEIKVKKMEYFKKRNIKIHDLSDLLNIENYTKLNKCLLNAFSEVLMYDNTIKLKELPPRERTVLINGKNPKFWTELKQQGKEIKKKRSRFKNLVLKYGKQKLQETIHTIIVQNSVKVTSINTSTEREITEYLNQFQIKSVPKVTDFETANLISNSTQSNTSNIRLQPPPITRNCKTCGREITNQKKGSVFCSELLYGKQAKKCRNDKSNPFNNRLKKEKRMYSGLLLFNL